jgi:uncharacterized protein YqfA (UPF0365 family)
MQFALVQGSEISLVKLVGGVILAIGFLIFLFVFLRYANLYVRSILTNAGVGLLDMVAMSLRRVSPSIIVNARVTLVQAGIEDVSKRDLEAHYLAGGNVDRVVRAMVTANRARIELPFRTAARHRPGRTRRARGGEDLGDPQGDRLPQPRLGKSEIAAVAKNGIQVLAKARITVRTNLSQLIGGAGEETIIARVGEGIVSTIGSKASHQEVLENPDHISKTVLARGLDAQTAFEIVSIDIADVDIGNNIGARLQRTRPRPTSAWPRRTPRSAVRWPSLPSRSSRPR